MERSSIVTLIVCLTLVGPVPSVRSSSARAQENLGAAGRPSQSLHLTATVLAQKYCKVDSDVDGTSLRLLLTFTNQAPESILLYKGSRDVLRYLVSQSLRHAAKHEYLASVSSTFYSAGLEKKLDEHSLAALFIPLAPGESRQIESSVTVIAARGASKNTSYLEPGEYLLQVQVATWPTSIAFEQSQLERWQQKGLVWRLPVTSEPFPLIIEAQRKTEDCSPFAELIDASVTDPNVRNADGLTPLLIAISFPNTERFLSLLTAGADVNSATNSGVTPLMMAASYSESLFLKELIKNRANVNATSKEGTTALMDAVRAGLVENVKLLIEAGADVNVKSKQGRNALMLSTELQNAEKRAAIAALLRSAGATEW